MKSTLLTAEKARKIAESQDELESILDDVFRKVLKGEMYLLFEEGEISPSTITMLQELGYKISKLQPANLYALEWCEDD